MMPAEHRAQLGHHRVEVDDPRLQHLFPAEGEQLTGESRRPVRGPVDLQHVEPALVLVVDRPQQQLRVSDDGRQEVVEVVGDAAGELADGLHLLGLAELLLEDLLLADVSHVDEEVERAARRVLHHRRVGVDPHGLAVAAEQPLHQIVRFARTRDQAPPLGAIQLHVIGVGDGVEIQCHQLGFGVAEQLAEGRGHFPPPALQLDVRRHDQRHAHGTLKFRLALAQGGLDPQPFQGAAAVIGQGLEDGEIGGVVRPRRVALNGEDARHPLAMAHRDEHQRGGGSAHGAERRQALPAGEADVPRSRRMSWPPSASTLRVIGPGGPAV